MKPFKLIHRYLRREPTTDTALRDYAKAAGIPIPHKLDVVAYGSPNAKTPLARWPWHYSTKPTRRNKRVTLNCFTYDVVWLPDRA